ncbi:MAG: hypothetical protein METHAR1v1_1690002 [Methanothrix sp.]|nr:MAG: hypothetical protein METHAR1v1_1690002 [Methanothrix sp.]
MSSSRRFLLDANIFIEAHRRYYAFDIAPPFWNALINNAKNGRLLSIDRVEIELKWGGDELADWTSGSFHQFFASTDEKAVTEAYRRIMVWSQGQTKFTGAAKAKFADAADSWLVAYALAKDSIVVTHEQFRPEAKNEIMIPNACKAFGVEYVDTFQMMRALGVRFV